MNPKRTRGTDVNIRGVITFLDVLGWKGVYNRQPNAIVSLTTLIDGLRNQAGLKRARVEADTQIKSVSDTIAMLTPCTDTEILNAIGIHGELCAWVIPESIYAEIPVRGATAFGEFKMEESIFVGSKENGPGIERAIRRREEQSPRMSRS